MRPSAALESHEHKCLVVTDDGLLFERGGRNPRKLDRLPVGRELDKFIEVRQADAVAEQNVPSGNNPWQQVELEPRRQCSGLDRRAGGALRTGHRRHPFGVGGFADHLHRNQPVVRGRGTGSGFDRNAAAPAKRTDERLQVDITRQDADIDRSRCTGNAVPAGPADRVPALLPGEDVNFDTGAFRLRKRNGQHVDVKCHLTAQELVQFLDVVGDQSLVVRSRRYGELPGGSAE